MYNLTQEHTNRVKIEANLSGLAKHFSSSSEKTLENKHNKEWSYMSNDDIKVNRVVM